MMVLRGLIQSPLGPSLDPRCEKGLHNNPGGGAVKILFEKIGFAILPVNEFLRVDKPHCLIEVRV